MSRKPRMNVVWTAPQLAWLCQEADRLGIEVSELARRIVDHYRGASWRPVSDHPEAQDGASQQKENP